MSLLSVLARLGRRSPRPSPPAAGTTLFLEPQWRGGSVTPHALEVRGTLGRGKGAYVLDSADPFVAGVSREHLLLDPCPEGVYATPCTSPTLGFCVVDVLDPFGGERRLIAGTPSLIEPGSSLLLGDFPAPGFTERPNLVLQDLATTLVGAMLLGDGFPADRDAEHDLSDPGHTAPVDLSLLRGRRGSDDSSDGSGSPPG